MEENVNQIKSGTIVNVYVSVENLIYVENGILRIRYIWWQKW